MCNIRRKNLNLEASNNASKRCVVFIGRDECAVENKHQPTVDVFKDPQKVVSSLELKDFKYLRECCKILQVETPGNGFDEEISTEVGLHFFDILVRKRLRLE